MKFTVLNTASVILFLPVGVIADEAEGKAGYRSDLWKMEFHQSEEDEAVKDVTPDGGDSFGEPVIDAGLDVALDRLVANTVADGDASVAFNNDSPSTESADPVGGSTSKGHTRELPNRRMGSQTSLSAVNPTDVIPVSNGPSLLTLFVALVAGVVITSAVFSGKQ